MKRYPLKIGEPEIAALKILADSPRGASSYHLVTRHGVAPGTIFNILENGLRTGIGRLRIQGAVADNF